MVFLFQTKTQLQFHHQFKHYHQKLTTRQPTNFGMKYQSFRLAARVTAEQFKQHTVKKSRLNKVNYLCNIIEYISVSMASSQRSML